MAFSPFNKLSSPLAAIFLLPLALSAPANAASVSTSGCAAAASCTMTELFGGGSITVDDVLFNSFVFVNNFSNVTIGTGDITVTGVAGPGTAGLDWAFSPAIGVSSPGDNIEFVFDFAAAVSGSPRVIDSATLNLTSAGFSGDAFMQVAAVINVTTLLEVDVGGPLPLMETEALSSLTALSIVSDYQAEPFEAGAFSSLSAYSFELALTGDLPVTPVPLPAAFPLFGTGLGILGLIGWRRRRKAAAV